MKAKYYFPLFLLTISVCEANAQVEVVGVSSSHSNSPSYGGEKPDMYVTIGGPSTSDYYKIDDAGYECIYRYLVVSQDKDGNPVKEDYSTILQLGKNAGRFTDYAVYRRDSVAFSERPDKSLWTELDMATKKETYRFYPDILQNYPTGELTYTDIVTPFYQEYTETFPAIEWTIGEEQDTVCGYVCTKATGTYGGRDWEAWFAEEIPSEMGPWKFSGLPGLIMKATDSEGIHEFRAISFREGKTPVAKPNNSLIQKTTREKFIAAKSTFEEKPKASINPAIVKSVAVSDGKMIFNGVEIPKRPNKYIPIEVK